MPSPLWNSLKRRTPLNVSRIISSDHQSPMTSKLRATGHPASYIPIRLTIFLSLHTWFWSQFRTKISWIRLACSTNMQARRNTKQASDYHSPPPWFSLPQKDWMSQIFTTPSHDSIDSAGFRNFAVRNRTSRNVDAKWLCAWINIPCSARRFSRPL